MINRVRIGVDAPHFFRLKDQRVRRDKHVCIRRVLHHHFPVHMLEVALAADHVKIGGIRIQVLRIHIKHYISVGRREISLRVVLHMVRMQTKIFILNFDVAVGEIQVALLTLLLGLEAHTGFSGRGMAQQFPARDAAITTKTSRSQSDETRRQFATMDLRPGFMILCRSRMSRRAEKFSQKTPLKIARKPSIPPEGLQSFRLLLSFPIDCARAQSGCLGYSIRDKTSQINALSILTLRIAGRISMTPDFRSARHPQRKTER